MQQNRRPWYIQILIILLLVLFIPVILLFLLSGLFSSLIDFLKEPKRKKEYFRSAYYQDLKIPYRKWITVDPYYCFYNEAKDKNMQISFVYQTSNNAAYFVNRDTALFLAPFDNIGYDNINQQWMVEEDGESLPLEDVRRECTKLLDESHRELNVVFLVSEPNLVPVSYFSETENPDDENNYAKELLPSYVCLETDFLSAYLMATEEKT